MRNQEMLTPHFVSIDFTIKIKVRLDKDLSNGFPLELSVGEPDRLEQDAVCYDDDEQKHHEIAHLHHLQTHHNEEVNLRRPG